MDCQREVERARRVKAVCLACQRKRYVLANPDIIKNARERYYKKHKDKVLEGCKKYYIKNRNSKVEYARQQRKLNKDTISIQRKKNYRINKEKRLVQVKIYQQKNKEKIAEKKKVYRQNNGERILLLNANTRGRIRASQKTTDITTEWLRELLENTKTCLLCSNLMEKGNRQIDHIIPINIDGQHKKDNIRIICRKCNLSRPKDGRDLI